MGWLMLDENYSRGRRDNDGRRAAGYQTNLCGRPQWKSGARNERTMRERSSCEAGLDYGKTHGMLPCR